MQRKSDIVLVCLLAFMTIWCFILQCKLIKLNDTMDTVRNKYIELYNEVEEKQMNNNVEKTSVKVDTLYPKDVTLNKVMCEGCLKLKGDTTMTNIPDINQPMNLCSECRLKIEEGKNE